MPRSRDPNTYIYDPASNTWSNGPTLLHNDDNDEEGWVKLPDGSTLAYSIFGDQPQSAQRLVLGATDAQDHWVDAGKVPVQLDSGSPGYELGPGFLLPNGTVFWVGATGNTAIYTPPALAGNATGTWVAGPQVKDSSGNLIGGYDAPGEVLPNGKVLFLAGTADFGPPASAFEYDPTSNTITPVNALGPDFTDNPPFVCNMLDLPSGQVLTTTDYENYLYLYNPDAPPDPSWAPTVNSVVSTGGGSYVLTGTQINGLDEGAAYGDDQQMATNYPIIKLTDQFGNVTFANTTNWSSTWVATGNALKSASFTLPAQDGPGTYTLNVIANGISSKNFQFNTFNLKAIPPANAVETHSFTAQVGTFQDSSGFLASQYKATIDWGDGLPASAGTVQILNPAQGGNPATYQVIGSHTYQEGGTYQMTVSVTTPNGAIAMDSVNINVAGLPLQTTAFAFQLKEGQNYSGNLATFIDTASAPRQASFYTATLTFGDDGTKVNGLIVADPNGGFDVLDPSGHLYGGGSYSVQVTITKPGFTITANATAIVADSCAARDRLLALGL